MSAPRRNARPAQRRHRLVALPASLIGIVLGGGALTALGVGAIRLRRSPALAIRSIQVQGLKTLDPQPLRELMAPLKGLPLESLSTGELRERIEALPGIAGASVSKVLPDTLYVEIHEREAVARVSLPAGPRLVDGSGALLGPAAPDARLPWLEPVEAADAAQRAPLAGYAGRMRAEAPALFGRIGALRPDGEGVAAETDTHLQLLLPDSPGAAQLRLAAVEPSRLPGFGPGARLDLRFAGQVWYQPPPAVSAPAGKPSAAYSSPSSPTPEPHHD